jgi:hypothetical protein
MTMKRQALTSGDSIVILSEAKDLWNFSKSSDAIIQRCFASLNMTVRESAADLKLLWMLEFGSR